VRTEAAPTAKAIRKSADGTASETVALTSLTQHVDTVFYDLFLKPRTFWQKVSAWVRLLITPGAVLGAKAF
jgi:hypothetical protein